MPGIACARRGGLASQPTISKAIALAQDTSLLLHLLYVVNLGFLAQTPTSRVQVPPPEE